MAGFFERFRRTRIPETSVADHQTEPLQWKYVPGQELELGDCMLRFDSHFETHFGSLTILVYAHQIDLLGPKCIPAPEQFEQIAQIGWLKREIVRRQESL